MVRLLLDTNVIEYFLREEEDRKYRKASQILQSINDGLNEGIVIPPILLEIYYRLSELNDENYANAFIISLLAMPNISTTFITKDIGITATY